MTPELAARLLSFTKDMAEGDCSYNDGCPIFPKVALRHYRCHSCLAREALGAPQAPPDREE